MLIYIWSDMEDKVEIVGKSKRISIEVSDSFLLDLKKRALNRNITLKRYIVGVLNEHIKKEDSFN